MASVQLHSLPLPPKPTTYEMWQKDWPQLLYAYHLACNAEGYATQQALSDSSKQAKDDILYARVFGYLLVELFNWRAILTEGPFNQLLMELQLEDRGDGNYKSAVFHIGKLYHDCLLRSFWTTTPSHLAPPSPLYPSFDMVDEMAEHTSKDDGTAKCKALTRDGFRCLLTGLFDETSTEEDPKLDAMCIQLDTGSTNVAPCRIWCKMQGVDPIGGSGTGRDFDKTPYATTAMSIVKSFGLNDLVQGLEEEGADRLGNLLSLDPTCRCYFDKLNLWFEYDKPNRYRVCVAQRRHERYLRSYDHLESDDCGHLFVTFSRTDVSQELPNPQLLGLHAVCARVAHMSGAAKAIFDDEGCNVNIEDTSVVVADTSSAHLLHLSTPIVAIPSVS